MNKDQIKGRVEEIKGKVSARHSAPHGRFLDLPVTKIDSPRGESI